MTRPSRRRPVLLGALLLASALLAAACSDSTKDGTEPPVDPSTTSTTQATSTTAAPTTSAPPTTAATTTTLPGKIAGGEVVLASVEEPATLNSFAPGGDSSIVSVIGQGYLAGVQDIDGFSLNLIPELVTALPTVSNGGVTVNDDGTMTVRYEILDDAVWSDGEPISGFDFEFTLETILNPRLNIFRTTYEDIVDWSAEAKAFEYTLAAPTTQFETLFNPILPKHAVEETNFISDWNDTMWPSAGPFVFDEWVKGEHIKLVRNDNYWKTDPVTGQQLPLLDSVVFRFMSEAESIEAFENREIDIVQPVTSSTTIQGLRDLEADGATVEVLSGPDWEHLGFQFGDKRFGRNPESPNHNLNYRKAIAHAIDKKAIVDEILPGQLEPLNSFVEVFAPSLSLGAWSQYNYDPDVARTFVEAAKVDLGTDTIKTVFTTTSNIDTRVRFAELFGDMLTDVGIEYSTDLEDSQIFLGQTLPFGQWDLGGWAWSSSPGFPALIGIFELWDPESPPPDGRNAYRWGTAAVSGQGAFNQGESSVIDDNTARFAEIRQQLTQSVDVDVLVPLIAEAESILADQVVVIPLYARVVSAAVWSDQLAGFKHNPTQAGYTWNIENWYRVDGG